jgi:hypothetical protein
MTPRGNYRGTLYCYGGCGRRYADFGLDILLPTWLWNQVATGFPFGTEPVSQTEGRGGVLCTQCIVNRLAILPGVTAVYLDIEDKRAAAAPHEGR